MKTESDLGEMFGRMRVIELISNVDNYLRNFPNPTNHRVINCRFVLEGCMFTLKKRVEAAELESLMVNELSDIDPSIYDGLANSISELINNYGYNLK